jgi:uncharacterized membrane protein YgcG
MARRATMRASDADREQVAERLRQATAEGRLIAEELEQRLGAAFSARTYGELDALVSDLPGNTQLAPQRRQSRSLPIGPAQAVGLVFLIPILVAFVIAAVAVIASLFAVWAVVIALGWYVFGHRLGGSGRYTRRVHGCCHHHYQRGRPGARQSSTGTWL